MSNNISLTKAILEFLKPFEDHHGAFGGGANDDIVVASIDSGAEVEH